jgi:hypothetical protein
VSIDAPGDNAPDVQGLVPIEPSRDPKVTTAEFRSNRVPWQPLPLSDNSPVQ